MRTYRLERTQIVPRSVEETFAFFADAANLEAITPPWLRFRIVTPPPTRMGQGTRIEFRLRWRGVPLRWLTRIQEWCENERFVDQQIRGPYGLWHHLHTFTPVPGGTRVADVVSYALSLGPLGRLAHAVIVGRDLDAIFDYRADQIATLLGVGGGCRGPGE
jgi:ligand-binding SRPBCC domain-containing protein